MAAAAVGSIAACELGGKSKGASVKSSAAAAAGEKAQLRIAQMTMPESLVF